MEGRDSGMFFDPDAGDDAPRAVIGWVHHALPHGIELRVQSARSSQALSAGVVETNRLVMTRNQALLLARSLLEGTDQRFDEPPRPRGVLRKVTDALRGR